MKQFLKTKPEIKEWLYDMGIENYTINKDLIVNVHSDVDLSYKELKAIPVQFGVVEGNFSLFDNDLASLKGSPKKVLGYFDCSYNRLKNLKYCPKEIEGNFYAVENFLKELKNSPELITGSFKFHGNPIKSIDGLTTKTLGNFEHSVDSLEQAIPEFKHLYIKLKSYDCGDYSLTLTSQQISTIQIQCELNLELPSKPQFTKKLKL